jgi:peptidyl-dipeptidase A
MEIARIAAQEREAAVAEFVERVVAELEPLQRQHNEALWLASVTGEQIHQQESARLDTQIRKVFARRESYQFLREVHQAGGVSEPLLQRQALLLLNHFRAHQIRPEMIESMVRLEKTLDSRFNNHRAELDGERVSDNQLRRILRNADDAALRRRAWEASKQIGAEVVSDLLELVRQRNQAACEVGFDNYYSMMLTLDELDEAELFALLDELEQGTRPLFESYKRELDARLSRRFGIAPEALLPWHYGDPFFQEAPAVEMDLDSYFRERSLPELAERFYAAIGFDIRGTLKRSDLFEKPGKNQHAFCVSIDRLADVRVLCNIKSNEFWMSTVLHEFGHAVYDQCVGRSLPFLLRAPAHALTTEASAMLFGRLSKNAVWLARYAGMDAADARRAAEIVGRAIRAQLLVQTRWCLVMSHMERQLYRDPSQDLVGRWWGLVERFQNVRRPEGRLAADWASKIHFSVAPVYYHNYMLGEIMASQLQATLLGDVLGGGEDRWDRYVSSPRVGAHLEEKLYRAGKSVDWREAIRRATGRALTPAAFVDELTGRAQPEDDPSGLEVER